MKTTIYFKRYIKNDPTQKKEIRFWPNGEKRWILNGFLHREDGPAVIYHNGTKYWYLEGQPCFQQDIGKPWKTINT